MTYPYQQPDLTSGTATYPLPAAPIPEGFTLTLDAFDLLIASPKSQAALERMAAAALASRTWDVDALMRACSQVSVGFP